MLGARRINFASQQNPSTTMKIFTDCFAVAEAEIARAEIAAVAVDGARTSPALRDLDATDWRKDCCCSPHASRGWSRECGLMLLLPGEVQT